MMNYNDYLFLVSTLVESTTLYVSARIENAADKMLYMKLMSDLFHTWVNYSDNEEWMKDKFAIIISNAHLKHQQRFAFGNKSEKYIEMALEHFWDIVNSINTRFGKPNEY